MTDPLELAFDILVNATNKIRNLQEETADETQKLELEVLLDGLSELQYEVDEVINP